WPRLLVDKRTEKLVLAYRWFVDQPNPARLLPADILRCDSLQELTLDYWTFPSGTEVVLPRLRILAMVRIGISEQELESLIAASPVLESLRLTLNSPKHVRLRSQSLQCALVGLSRVEEFTVVDTPLLERLYLFLPPTGVVGFRIACAPNLRVLGYLDTRAHKLQIGNSVIGVRLSSLNLSLNLQLFHPSCSLCSERSQ
uniref:F-box/LRR-repeat protein 15/At3g58940/PEG3-like LRR domain-containing protein n=1 Tax=Aegilops tauschii subsp. strangulata TaxID=200361 RepID=A0A453SG07_AEGTS